LLDQQPDDRALVEGRAYAELNRAQSLGLLGDPAEEIEAYRSAIADFEAVLESLTDVPSLRENLAIARCGLGCTANRNFQNRECVRWVDSGLAEYERLSNRTTPLMRHYEGLVQAGSVMGSVLAELGDVEHARQNLDSAVTLLVHKLVPSTDECRYHRDLAIASTHLGRLSQQQGEWDQARTEFEIAIRLLREVLESDPTEVHAREALASAFECLGDLWHEQQRAQAAADEYQRALEQRDDPRLPPLPVFEYRKATLLLKFDDAQKTETAVEIASQLHEQYPENGCFRVLLAAAYNQAGHDVSAIELLEATDASVHLGAGPARDFHLAMAYRQRARAGDDELARRAYDRAIEWMSREAPGNLQLRRLAAQTAAKLGLAPPDR
jgi:tetratricopeptide (TPR) repeat protein